MLFMVIEYFRDGNPELVGERFKLKGRMLPEDVVYQASWMDSGGARCFQIMEAPNLESLDVWTQSWDDLIRFEIIPVLTSGDFWARRNTQ